MMLEADPPPELQRPIMADQVLACLRPEPGDIVVDCTLGGGGHAALLLERVRPGGRVIGIDVDPIELPLVEARLRAAGHGPDAFVAHRGNFAGLRQVLALERIAGADMILVDLGVSSRQLDNPDRGFSYKHPGPLDMRMNPAHGEPAWRLLVRIGHAELARLLAENADEPHAELIAGLLKARPFGATHAVERHVRIGLAAALPHLEKAEIKRSLRRTFQALRIAVNDEFPALDSLLRSLPECLAPGGRAACLTFHSGEDRRVKKAFQAGVRAGAYSDAAARVIRPTMEEVRANRRVSSAKLRWAVRATAM
jgi:16S rRNA (cytosine1402-N4)-methyltransferase